MDKENKNNMLSSNNDKNINVLKVDIDVMFSGDTFGLFVFKKTERIVSALYLLSGFMSDNEPMKNKIRTVAVDMLESALSLSNRIWGEDYFHKNLLEEIFEASVLFDVAKTVNMISKMNYEIIATELKKLADFIVSSTNTYSSAKIALEQNFFDGDYNYIPDQKNLSELKNTDKNIYGFYPSFDKGQKDIKDITNNDVLNKMSVKETAPTDKNKKDKTNRQDIILSMLKGGKKLTTKDFVVNIKDCSEKTIQRELLSMVANGVLKKEGERRWSKYFLAS